MLKKLLSFFASFFMRKEDESYEYSNENSYSNAINSPIKKIQKSKKTTELQELNAELISLKIKYNIYFLTNLMEQFRPHKEYDSYLRKLEDLHDQSSGCLRIIFKIKKDAPYYKATLKTVYSHTLNVAELMEFK